MPILKKGSPLPVPGTSVSAAGLVRKAMKEISVLAQGENPTAEELNDGLESLNMMVDGFNSERLLIYSVAPLGPFNLTPGVQRYTLGLPDGTIKDADGNSIARPPRIERMSVLYLANQLQPLEEPLDYVREDEWQRIPVKNVQSAIPRTVYDDQNFPQRNLNFFPIPTAPIQVIIYGWTGLTQFPDTTTQLIFPPQYYEAIFYNLAVRLASSFSAAAVLSPITAGFAVSTLAKIKSFNVVIPSLRCDPAVVSPDGGHYDWRTDSYVKR